MTRVVMIGRRTKGSVRLMASGGGISGDFRFLGFHDGDLAARGDTELAAGDDEFAGLQAFRDDGEIADSAPDFHLAHLGVLP